MPPRGRAGAARSPALGPSVPCHLHRRDKRVKLVFSSPSAAELGHVTVLASGMTMGLLEGASQEASRATGKGPGPAQRSWALSLPVLLPCLQTQSLARRHRAMAEGSHADKGWTERHKESPGSSGAPLDTHLPAAPSCQTPRSVRKQHFNWYRY